jgi:hypothetical protein
MHSKQEHSRMLERNGSLERLLPEILVQRQEQSTIRLRAVKQAAIRQAGTIRSCPQNIVALAAEYLDEWERKVLVSEKPHQAGIG